jgi:hypothetical protein
MAATWAADLVSNVSITTGSWVQWGGGILSIIVEKTSTLDLNIELKGPDGTGIIIPAFDNITTETVIDAVVPAGQIRADVIAGTAVTVRAVKVT